MYGLGGLGQVEVGERRRRAKWLEEKEKKEKEEKEKTKDRSVPDGSDKNAIQLFIEGDCKKQFLNIWKQGEAVNALAC